MSTHNDDDGFINLTQYQQFQVKFVSTNLTDDGVEFEINHGYWTVTGLKVHPDETTLWRLQGTHGVTDYVTPDELRITVEAGHRKHCVASAMISYIENWRDAADITAFDFAVTMQENGAWNGATEYLADGTASCICLTSKGLI
jgi:exo-beta-1,3-glucanase (GH17 family)